MAKTVGVDSGAYELKIVELDGSFRRPKLSKVCLEPAEQAGPEEDPQEVAAAQVREVLKEGGLGRENLAIAMPARDAILRELKVPFVGKEQIRRVIKFEAESEILSHSVDDLVVDFHTFEELDGETRVLVAAVPNEVMRARLDALESAHIEPTRVDLDVMALYRVAEWAGCFGEDVAQAAVQAAEAEDDEAAEVEAMAAALTKSIPGRGVQARIVADIGATSTRVVAVSGGELLDLRTLRIGADSLAKDISLGCGIKMSAARAAVQRVFDTGEDAIIDEADRIAEPTVEVPVAPPVESIGVDDEFVLVDEVDAGPASEPVPDVPPEAVIVTRELVATAKEQFLMRLRRELLRFSTGLSRVAAVDRVFVTGGGSSLPGVQAVFSEVFSAAAEPLDVLSRLSHDLNDEEAAAIGPRIPVAIGLALTELGGRGGFDFRREEFSYKRKFEQLKFPAAIACLLLILVPVFFIVRRSQQIDKLEGEFGRTFQFEVGAGGRDGESRVEATYFGILGNLVNRGFPVHQVLDGETRDKVLQQVQNAPVFDRLAVLRSQLQRVLETEQSRTGIYSDLQLRSGAYVLNWFANEVGEAEELLGKFLIIKLDLNIARDTERDAGDLEVEFMLQGDNYREREAALRARFERAFESPTCPFRSLEERSKEKPLQAGVPGAVLNWRLSVKPDFRANGGDS